MPPQRPTSDPIYTDHALERMKLRKISRAMVAQALKRPDSTALEDDGDTKFIKTIDERKLHVVARKTDKGDWLIISAWVRGEDDPKPLWVRLLTWPLRLLFPPKRR